MQRHTRQDPTWQSVTRVQRVAAPVLVVVGLYVAYLNWMVGSTWGVVGCLLASVIMSAIAYINWFIFELPTDRSSE